MRIQRTIEEVGKTFTERGYGKSAAAVRDITIREELVLKLAAYGPGLCFPGPRGGYLQRSTSRRVYWLSAIKAAGVTGMRFHDCRHSAISWWANSGIPLAAARDRAGHSTSRHLGHLALHARRDEP